MFLSCRRIIMCTHLPMELSLHFTLMSVTLKPVISLA